MPHQVRRTTLAANRRRIEAVGWLVSIGLLCWFVYRSFSEVPFWQQLSWNATAWWVLPGVAAVYSLSLVNSGFVSWWLLRSVGDPQASVSKVMAASLLSQIAKYLPGNVAHHIGRVVLSRQLHLNTPRVLFVMLIETFWVLGVAAALVAFHGLTLGDQLISGRPELPLIIVIVGVALCAPYVFHGSFDRLYVWYLHKRGVAGRIDINLPSLWTALLSVLAYLANYLILGLTIALLGGYFFDNWHLDFLFLGSAFAVAWVVGFFTPGSPAGLGVREVILLGLLTPVYGVEAGTGITALLRLVTVMGDAMAWAMGGLAWRYARQDAS